MMNSQACIMLHGWGASHLRFEVITKELQQLGYQVSNQDLPGFGVSPQPQKALALDDYVEWVKGKIIHHKKVNLIGHSFGGQIATAFTIKYPELVESLVLIAPAAVRKKNVKITLFKKWVHDVRIFFETIRLYRYLKKIQQFVYWSIGNHDYFNASDIMKQTMENVITDDLTSRLSLIKKRVLLIWGDQDTATPYSDLDEYRQRILNLSLIIYADKDHYFVYSRQQVIARIIDLFLKKGE